ncbi:MAG TPA: DUF4124 domain-containing protein [Burkholderiaceae bacterium]|nr:DUF4124 domain-containing protein [Burkholderiaceae bacterium]
MLKPVFFAAVLGIASAMVQAQTVYKITGPDGRVTYTSEAPSRTGQGVSRLEMGRGNVIPAPPQAPPPSPSAKADELQERLLRERIEAERARREAYEADAARHRAEAERIAAARAECERQRWTRCDDPEFLVERGWIPPLPYRVPRDRPVVRPTSPRDQPAPMLPGSIPHQAPADQYLPRAYPPVPPGTPGYSR